MFRKLARLALFVGVVTVILLSLIPNEAMPSLAISDALAHMTAYGVLAFVGGIARRHARSLVMLATVLFLLGASLEFFQGLLPDRDASGYELLANMVGIAVGCLVAISINAALNRRRILLP